MSIDTTDSIDNTSSIVESTTSAEASDGRREIDADPDALIAELSKRPRWKRPRPLSRKITTALIVTSLLAVATFGGLNFFAASDLLVEGTEDQLDAIAAARANSIEGGTERLLNRVAAASADLGVVRALEDFNDAYEALNSDPLTPEQFAELEQFYEGDILARLEEVGLGGTTPVDEVLPPSNAGQYLQYHYRLPAGVLGEAPIDPGDGSLYTERNVEYQEFLSSLSEDIGGADLLLISQAQGGDIIYSVDKRIDIGANLVDGPYADNNLAQAVTTALPRVPTGDAVLTDFQVYIPAGGEPVAFAVSSVRSDTEIIGALAVEVPITSINAITTANGNWDLVGLSNGESYIVSADGTLQSESRLWIEDPAAYLDRVRDRDGGERLAELIEIFDSPVGIQTVDTEAVRTALEGDVFSGPTTNYLGQSTYASAQALRLPGTQWVIISEVSQSDATRPLYDYLLRIVLVMVILVPAAAIIGIALARRLTRPIGPTVRAAETIAGGERHPDLDEERRDEFGDLGRRLNLMARDLEVQETELSDEYERRRQLLLAVLPPHLVSDGGEVDNNVEDHDEATMVSIGIRIVAGELGVDEEGTNALHAAAAVAEELGQSHDAQRIRVAADRYLFAVGAGTPGPGADSALDFVGQFVTQAESLATEADTEFELHIGLSTGAVATGVLDQGSLTFGAWGDPVRRALAISALSRADQVLVDESTRAHATDGAWLLEPATDVVDLDDEPMDVYKLIGRATEGPISSGTDGRAAADAE
ncbi:MAG: adenylate/guanylate cyclase domain-containing protein [Actinomycetota bacterium]